MRSTNSRVYFLFAFIFVGLSAFAQRDYKTPKHALGLEVNATYTHLMSYWSNSNIAKYYDRIVDGASIVLPYQFSSDEYITGFQTGLGFHMWGVSRSNNQWSYYTIGVPVVLQLKLSKPFWLELGFQINTLVYEDIVEDEQNIQIPNIEGQAVLGFRYNIYKTWSFKGRMHFGLTPALTQFSEAYRMIAFELGMAYLFPLKK